MKYIYVFLITLMTGQCFAAEDDGRGKSTRVQPTAAASASSSGKGSLFGSEKEIEQYLRKTVPPLIIDSTNMFYSPRYLIDIVMGVPTEERESLIALALHLVTDDMSALKRLSIIELLIEIPAADRESVATQAWRLTTDDMDDGSIKGIMSKISQVPAAEREAFVTQLLRLRAEGENWRIGYIRSIESLMYGLSQVLTAEREAFVTQTLGFITADMDAIARTRILHAMGSIPAEERAESIAYAHQLLEAHGGAGDADVIVQYLNGVLPEEEDSHEEGLPEDVVAQEAVVRQRKKIVKAYEKLMKKEAVRKLLPTKQDNEVFKKTADTLRAELESFQAFAVGKQKFRLEAALRGLDILMGVRDGHAIDSAAHYQASSIHGLPRIAELFVLAYRVYREQDTHAFVKVWFVENQQRWKTVVQLFGDKFPHLRSNKEIGQALMADEVKGSPFIKIISEVLEGKSESLSPQQAKFIRPLLSSYRKNREKWLKDSTGIEGLERMMPLIEALFMTARGHNAELENPTETDSPACANGLQLQLLKAIAESKVAGTGATGLLAGVTIEACDVPLDDASASSASSSSASSSADASASSAAAASPSSADASASSAAAASPSSGSDSDQANSGAGGGV